jgi:hypothetical protein
MADWEYTTLNAGDLLLIARDTLRGRESDHFRLSLLAKTEPEAYGTRLEALEAEIKELRKEVSAREKAAEKEAKEASKNG